MRTYDADTDYENLCEWWALHKQAPIALCMIPDSGLIVEGVAAGFLYLTNAKLGIIDLYVSNPKASKEARNNALNEITEELISLAHHRDCKAILATSSLQAVEKRALDFGFENIGNVKVFLKNLEGA